MGTEKAIEPQEGVVEVEEAEIVDETPNTNGEEAATESATENEIVLDGDEGSQPDKQSGIKKRINKLNAKREEAEGKASDAARELANEKEKTKLLRMALEQSKEASKVNTPPDPDDFDDGVRDPKYAQALQAYQKPFIDAAVEAKTSHLSQAVKTDEVDPGLVKRQTKHYERAETLGINDFEDVEDKAIDILGKDITNGLIKGSDNSHLVLYYLGKNPDKAEHFSELVKADPVKAILDLGALGAKLSVKPKGKTEPAPDPDEEIQGGSPASAQNNRFQSKYDAAIKAVSKGGDMSLVIEAKKAAKEAGVTLKR